MTWLKHSLYWVDNKTLFVSIPFTWELPKVRKTISFYKRVYVGGPAVDLMPYYFADCEHVEAGGQISPGPLQRFNLLATRTTTGCIRRCQFCGVGKGLIEHGGFEELSDWPDLPVIADNNLLAASQPHFDKVMERLERWQWTDFEQGLDVRLLTPYHAERIARIKKPMVRLALDNFTYAEQWKNSLLLLTSSDVALRNIRSYALIGFDSGPDEAWKRCEWIETHGIKVLPMWFHQLDALKENQVTEDQVKFGWNDFERRRIMQWFYWHKKAIV